MNVQHRGRSMIFEPKDADPARLREAFSRFVTGVTVVTCQGDRGPVAMTANSFSSISLEPPLVMWAAALKSRRYPAFAAAAHFAVHILGADQQELADMFAKDGLALKSLEHDTNAHGVPVLPRALAIFECRQSAIHMAGDHAIILGEVERATIGSGDALTFFNAKFGRLSAS